ncbi:MAG TPA: hypothetical protein VE569_01910 [Acidimicrobiia bacterium]|nr:hypothetical protein [Acidimicrobiia bacterium]
MNRFKNTQRMAVVLAATALFAAVVAGPAAADGPSPESLAGAGWTCFPHFVIHCVPDGDALFSGEADTVLIMTFGNDGEFWGTEFLIREDLYNGQPCPQDPLTFLGNGESGAYLYLPELEPEPVPLPYYVCHHFDSPFT